MFVMLLSTVLAASAEGLVYAVEVETSSAVSGFMVDGLPDWIAPIHSKLVSCTSDAGPPAGLVLLPLPRATRRRQFAPSASLVLPQGREEYVAGTCVVSVTTGTLEFRYAVKTTPGAEDEAGILRVRAASL